MSNMDICERLRAADLMPVVLPQARSISSPQIMQVRGVWARACGRDAGSKMGRTKGLEKLRCELPHHRQKRSRGGRHMHIPSVSITEFRSPPCPPRTRRQTEACRSPLTPLASCANKQQPPSAAANGSAGAKYGRMRSKRHLLQVRREAVVGLLLRTFSRVKRAGRAAVVAALFFKKTRTLSALLSVLIMS